MGGEGATIHLNCLDDLLTMIAYDDIDRLPVP